MSDERAHAQVTERTVNTHMLYCATPRAFATTAPLPLPIGEVPALLHERLEARVVVHSATLALIVRDKRGVRHMAVLSSSSTRSSAC